MNIALIIAGGSGTRTGQDVPKQFLTVYDIPIIAYTMKNIEKIPCIDEIYVVGPQGWENFITSYAKQCNVTKFKQVIHGGATRHESIYHGILQLAKHNATAPSRWNPAMTVCIFQTMDIVSITLPSEMYYTKVKHRSVRT